VLEVDSVTDDSSNIVSSVSGERYDRTLATDSGSGILAIPVRERDRVVITGELIVGEPEGGR
jgi:hypothetical protein